ncbi:hypothetical protein D9611_013823 [Ephemerocybe angulata]|uniref:Macrofage activating glycoprotein n=1 Tax=Ephemerocybe angulata TaxID=980116 RepID=A0A8H5C4V2_9AGAR|nr:hypothetical protein D9611_013823 [Tulosesus angulatus]
MIGSSSIAVAALLALSPLALAQAPTNQFPQTPLADKRYDSPAALPYKVDSDTGLLRGSQAGFNICNSTTENQSSLCQTSYFNSVEGASVRLPLPLSPSVRRSRVVELAVLLTPVDLFLSLYFRLSSRYFWSSSPYFWESPYFWCPSQRFRSTLAARCSRPPSRPRTLYIALPRVRPFPGSRSFALRFYLTLAFPLLPACSLPLGSLLTRVRLLFPLARPPSRLPPNTRSPSLLPLASLPRADFCIWGPIEHDSTVADTEGEMVAWCSKPGHGTRLIPAGALTGIQWIKTPDYVQAVGFLDQSQINIKAGDWGGEMDPHGADLRGNPMGGVIFSTAFGGSAKQVIEWHNFVGGNKFCFKACDPAGPNAAHFCEHIYDRIGCDYNIPNAAQDKVFESCLGDNQDYPGVYTSNGQVMTYTQPAESLGAISTMPYTPKVPASSSCSTFESAKVYTGLPTAAAAATTTGSASGSAATGSAGATGTSKAGTAVGAKATGAVGNGAGALGVGLGSLMGVVFAGLFLS